jgi:hypothetical protein
MLFTESRLPVGPLPLVGLLPLAGMNGVTVSYCYYNKLMHIFNRAVF